MVNLETTTRPCTESSFDPEETAAFVTSAVVLLPVFASASMPIGRSDVDLAQQLQL